MRKWRLELVPEVDSRLRGNDVAFDCGLTRIRSGFKQTPERDSSPCKSMCRRKLGVRLRRSALRNGSEDLNKSTPSVLRLRRSALRKGSAFPGLGYSSNSPVYGEAAPRRVRRSLTPNDKGILGATERQSLSAKQAAQPQDIPQPFPAALTIGTGQPSRRRSRKSSLSLFSLPSRWARGSKAGGAAARHPSAFSRCHHDGHGAAKQAAEPKVIGRQVGRPRDKLSSSIKWPSIVHFVLDNCRPYVLACAHVRSYLPRKRLSSIIQ